MEELIVTIVKALVDYPEEVVIEKNEQRNQVLYSINVHQDDIGKVIGKQGRIARAIRTVVYAAGTHTSKRIQLEIND
ncbi:KH domain-containing protein [Metabacillus arenae]|uniref:RNA-binding protein KhpA n=1 Tax=Metabacillus arenae TaxID=2771434 RepID=A0A926NEZ4_9BACI|nr:KH domain-containing protein [Metabacillus arenae]MBD1380021.1 KH domain-containing protein [Metabacillus arenae]